MTANRFAGLLTLAVAALAAGALAGCGDRITTTTTYQVSDAVDRVDVTSDGGRITLVAGATGTVRVTETSTYEGNPPHGTHEIRDGSLAITTTGCAGHSGACGIDYRLEVPAGLAVQLGSGGGAIDVQAALDTLVARSAGGAVTLRLTASPLSVEVDSAGGETVMHLPAGPYAVSAETDGGDLVNGVDNDPDAAHRVHVTTGGGNLTIGR